jgi:hypothetical protein
MKENVVAAIAAVSVPAHAGPGGWPVLNPRETSPETRDPVVIAYSLFNSPARFSFPDGQHFSGKDGTRIPHYIYSTDNSHINGVKVGQYENYKKNKTGAIAGTEELEKIPSGIKSFDEITGGRLPKGRPSLVSGGPGCGKTLFAVEFIIRGIVDYDKPGVFVAFGENIDDLPARKRKLMENGIAELKDQYAREEEEIKILIGQDVLREKVEEKTKKEIATQRQVDR